MGDLFALVRGKSVLNAFAQRASIVKSGQIMIEQIARERPVLKDLEGFTQKVDTALGID